MTLTAPQLSLADDVKVTHSDSIIKRSASRTSDSSGEKAPVDVKGSGDDDAERERRRALYMKYRPLILGGLAAAILGWWVSATVLRATRHRWQVKLPSGGILLIWRKGLSKRSSHGHSFCTLRIYYFVLKLTSRIVSLHSDLYPTQSSPNLLLPFGCPLSRNLFIGCHTQFV